jgi:hypothetical protein
MTRHYYTPTIWGWIPMPQWKRDAVDLIYSVRWHEHHLQGIGDWILFRTLQRIIDTA